MNVSEFKEKRRFGWNIFKMKVLASSAAMMFASVVLVLSFLAISNPAAVHPNSESATLNTVNNEATAPSLMNIEYYLPYPGILPDSPLYKIKALRDRIELWLTFDEKEKAKKELLYADKRINAAIFLMQGGRGKLSVTTATKAEKYLESAVSKIVSMAKSGKKVRDVVVEMDKSANKHIEVLVNLKEKVTGDDRKALEVALGTTRAADERLKQVLVEVK